MANLKRFPILYILASLLACDGIVSDLRSSDDDEVAHPTQVSGSYLASYHNTRARCGFKKENKNNYKILCHVVSINESNEEEKAMRIADGLSLSWHAPVVIKGQTQDEMVCSIDSNGLTQICDLNIKSPSMELKIKLDIVDTKTQRQRVESDMVLLPYSVEVAAGLVPSIPFSFTQTKQKTSQNDQKIKLGYQPNEFKALELDFEISNEMCTRDNKIYFVAGRQIFYEENGKVKLFAGYHRQQGQGDYKHRLEVSFRRFLSLHCVAGGVFVHDYGKLLFIHDDGRIKKLADGVAILSTTSKGEVVHTKKRSNDSSLIIQKTDLEGKQTTLLDSFDSDAVKTIPKDQEFYTCDDQCYIKISAITKLAYSATNQSIMFLYKYGNPKKYGLITYDLKSKEFTSLPLEVQVGPKQPDTQSISGIQYLYNQDGKFHIIAWVPKSKYHDAGPKLFSFDSESKIFKYLSSPIQDFKAQVSLEPPEGGEVEFRFIPDTLQQKHLYVYKVYPKSTSHFHSVAAYQKKPGEKPLKKISGPGMLDLVYGSLVFQNNAKTAPIRGFASLQVAADGSLYYNTLGGIVKVTPEGKQIYIAGYSHRPLMSSTEKTIAPRLQLPCRDIYDISLQKNGDILFLGSNDYENPKSIYKINRDYTKIELLATIPQQASSIFGLKNGMILFSGRDKIYLIDSSGDYKEIYSHKRASFGNILYDGEYILVNTHDTGVMRLKLNLETQTVDKSNIGLIGQVFYYDSSSLNQPSPDEYVDSTVTFRLKEYWGVALGEGSNVYIGGGNNPEHFKLYRLAGWQKESKTELFFGPEKNDQDCGTGVISSRSSKQGLAKAISGGLSKICAGAIRTIASYNGCDHKDESKRIFRLAVAQSFGELHNVVLISKQCDEVD